MESHYPQTELEVLDGCFLFFYRMESHYPQTSNKQNVRKYEFFYRMESHYPQTLLHNCAVRTLFFYRMESHYPQTNKSITYQYAKFFYRMESHPCVKYWIHIFSNFQSTFLLYFNFKIGFFKSLFIRSAYTTWSTTSDIVVILCPASLEDAPQWYILCLSVFQSMIIYLSWNSPPDF